MTSQFNEKSVPYPAKKWKYFSEKIFHKNKQKISKPIGKSHH